MRVSILIVIFDFLVSALLLFVVAPAPAQRRVRFAPVAGSTFSQASGDFSPLAVAQMEADWRAAADASWQEEQERRAMGAQRALVRTNESLQGALIATFAQLESNAVQTAGEIRSMRKQIAMREKERQVAEEAGRRVQSQLSDARKALKMQKDGREAAERQVAALGAKSKELIEQRGQLMVQIESLNKHLIGQQILFSSFSNETAQIARRIGDVDTRVTEGQAEFTLAMNQVTTNIAGIGVKVDQTGKKIGELGSRVGEMQTQLEQQQRQSAEAFERINGRIASLSTNLQGTILDLNDSQRRLDTAVRDLGSGLRDLENAVKPAEREQAREELLELLTALRELQTNLVGAVEVGAPGLDARALEGMRSQQMEVGDMVAELGSKLEGYSARRQGPYRRVSDSRMEISVSMLEKDLGGGNWINSDDSWSGRVFLPMFESAGQRFIAAYYADLGVDWREMIADGEMGEIVVNLGRPPGDGRWSERFHGDLIGLSEDARVILMPVNLEKARNLNALKLRGRGWVRDTGGLRLRLFKASAQGASFEVETSLDQSDPKYLVLKQPAFAETLLKPGESTPKPGDFLMTPDGDLVGIMVEGSRCFVLDEACISGGGVSMSVDHPDAYREAALELDRQRKEFGRNARVMK